MIPNGEIPKDEDCPFNSISEFIDFFKDKNWPEFDGFRRLLRERPNKKFVIVVWKRWKIEEKRRIDYERKKEKNREKRRKKVERKRLKKQKQREQLEENKRKKEENKIKKEENSKEFFSKPYEGRSEIPADPRPDWKFKFKFN